LAATLVDLVLQVLVALHHAIAIAEAIDVERLQDQRTLGLAGFAILVRTHRGAFDDPYPGEDDAIPGVPGLVVMLQQLNALAYTVEPARVIAVGIRGRDELLRAEELKAVGHLGIGDLRLVEIHPLDDAHVPRIAEVW